MLKMHTAHRAHFGGKRVVDLHNTPLADDGFKLIVTEQTLKIAALIANRLPLNNMQTMDRCFLNSEAAHELAYA
jgi:hypothetical protein